MIKPMLLPGIGWICRAVYKFTGGGPGGSGVEAVPVFFVAAYCSTSMLMIGNKRLISFSIAKL